MTEGVKRFRLLVIVASKLSFPLHLEEGIDFQHFKTVLDLPNPWDGIAVELPGLVGNDDKRCRDNERANDDGELVEDPELVRIRHLHDKPRG